jgi:peptide/nickel transport system permease protein
MYAYIVKRLLLSIPTILIISVFVFSLQKLLPGDPILVMAGEERDPQTLEYLRERYRLNDPLPVQYLAWLGSAVQGDLGIRCAPISRSCTSSRRSPATIQLAIMAILIAFLIGVPMGSWPRRTRTRCSTMSPTSSRSPDCRSPISGSASC